jgi:hypothetical protein
VNNKEKLHLAKTAGFWSEQIGSVVNPLNWYAWPFGMSAAAATPTRSLKDQGRMDSAGGRQVLKDLLIPGVAPYNSMKRLGTSIRGPELKEMKAEAEMDRVQRKKDKKDKKSD